ncbi:hypothetical protein BEWA_021610 [Theileria equi strain WA]|uniref:Uncharacterized protein n=1 Tax=Theileria equi strain WA TaxID=1537102 RepID=L0AVP2_THEEQ|nr:hypothetical protein BEWA_021610 [Theileria equi strain WA]AFZ79313.1 hypothetical protein BEWA_021610 [Theileria equi strain WA]|eukprot:XP_004828979.1 hypothetical protein BEWA_021610 [Theileria equi strain WA]
MVNHNNFPFGTSVSTVYVDTIAKSQEDVNLHKKYQNNTKNPVFYETITFDNVPISFFGIIILPPGENISLLDGGRKKQFISESLFDTNTSNIKVFVQTLDKNEIFVYKQLSILDYTELGMLFVYDGSKGLTTEIFTNKILIIGSFRSISYLILKRGNSEPYGLRLSRSVPLLSYVGHKALDLVDADKIKITDIDLERRYDSSFCYGFRELLNLEDGIPKSLWKTKLNLTSSILMQNQIRSLEPEKLNDTLLLFSQNKDDFGDKDEIIFSLYSYFDYTNLHFVTTLERTTLECVVELCISNITYTFDDHYYKLLDILSYDSKLALAILQNKNFVDSIFLHLSFKDNTILNSREAILSLISRLISHSYAMKYFLSSKSDRGSSLYNMLLKNVYNHPQYSIDSLFVTLKEISDKVALYSALHKTEMIFNESNEKTTDGHSDYCHLESLSASINESIDLMMNTYTRDDIKALVENDRNSKYYIISYIKDKNFLAIISHMCAKLSDKLSDFPVLIIDICQITRKPLVFMQKFVDIFDFSGLILPLYKVAEMILLTCENVGLVIRKGFPYHSDFVYDFGHSVKKDVYELLLYTRILRIFSCIYSEKSINGSIEVLNTLCNKTHNCYKILTDILNEKISDSIFDILNSTISGIKVYSDTGFYYSQLLLYILGEAISKDDTGKLVYGIGKNLISTTELFLALPFIESNELHRMELKGIKYTFYLLRNVFGNLPDPQHDAKLDVPIIESVDVFLRAAINSSSFIFHPKHIKRTLEYLTVISNKPMIKDKSSGSFSRKESATISESCISDKLRAHSISRDLHVNLIDIDWDDPYIANKRRKVNIPDDKYNYYLNLDIFPVPPAPIPTEIKQTLVLLLHLSSKRQYNELFRKFLLNSKQMDTMLEIWTHLISSIIPSLSTLANAEMDVLSSLIGYEWFTIVDSTFSTLKTILVLVYRSLRHLSSEDTYTPDDTNKVIGLDMHYINDDLLNLMVLTSSQLNFTKIWYHKSIYKDCISWLSKLMFYWFKRFKSSRGYLINHLMRAYVTIPKMTEAVSLLLISCNPTAMATLSFSIKALSDSEDSDDKSIIIDFENNNYVVSRTNNLDSNKNNPEINVNTTLFGLSDKLKNIDFELFLEFITTLISRSYTISPVSLVLNSQLSYIMVANSLPIVVLLKIVSEKLIDACIENSDEGSTDKALNLVMFYSNLLHICNSSGKVKNLSLFNLVTGALVFLNKFTKSAKEITIIGYALIYECYLAVFCSNNKLWNNDIILTVTPSELHDYIVEINSGVEWIFSTLNKCKIDFYTEDSDNKHEMLTLDIVLLGLQAIYSAFEIPFTTLNILYNISRTNLELVLRVLKKRSESETIKVNVSNSLELHNIINQISESIKNEICTQDNEAMTRKMFIELLILERIYEICNLIHVTGKYQDYFVLVCLQGSPDDGSTTIDKKTDVKISQNENISTKSKLHSKKKTTDRVFSKIQGALEKRLEELKSNGNDKKHIIANILLIIDCYEKLSIEIAKDALDLGIPKYIPGYLFSKKATQENITKLFVPLEPYSTENLIKKICHYADWDHWVNTIHLDAKTIDLSKDDDWYTKPLTYDGRIEVKTIDVILKGLTDYKKTLLTRKGGDEIMRESHDRLPSQPDNLTSTDTYSQYKTSTSKVHSVTASEWKAFDNELFLGGLSLISIIDNPSILLENNNKNSFINAVVKHKSIFNHLVLSGYDF